MRYQFKIVSNQKEKKLSYFFKNERAEWVIVSNTSALSRSLYTRTTLQEKGKDILREINCTYNIAGRGLDIFFFGTENDYIYLKDIIKNDFSTENIHCQYVQKNVAVVGKLSSGKTTLITALLEASGNDYHSAIYHHIQAYIKEDSSITWCELPGIEIGKDNILKTKEILDELMTFGLTDVIYCFSTSKIERAEKELIRHIKTTCPAVNVIIALTRCVDSYDAVSVRNDFTDISGVTVIPTMAKPLKTRGGIIEAYGIDEVIRIIMNESSS